MAKTVILGRSDAATAKRAFKNDAERVAFLFELYQRYTSLLPVAPTERQNYAEHFGKACLEAGRQEEPSIDVLLTLLCAQS